MKRVLLFALTVMLFMSASAKDTVVPEFICFVLNEQNECRTTFTFKTSKSYDKVYSIIMSVINSGDFMSTVSNKSESGFTFNGVLQSESRYNPFAGSFRTTVTMQGTVSYADGQVTIVLSNYYIDQHYTGYGVNQKRYNVNEVMSDIVRLQQTVASSTGKQRKEANKELEDKVDIVSESDSELNKRMMIIKAQL